MSGNTGNGALGNDISLVEGGVVNGPIVDAPIDNVGNGNAVGSGNDIPVGSGNDTSVDAPVDVPVEAPVEAPVDAPVGNGTDTDTSVGGSSVDGIDAEVDNLVDDVLGGLGLGLGD